MMDEKEIAHLSEDGQYLCANEDVPQHHLPLNLFYWRQTQSAASRCGGLGKETNLSEKSDGLQGNPENDGPA